MVFFLVFGLFLWEEWKNSKCQCEIEPFDYGSLVFTYQATSGSMGTEEIVNSYEHERIRENMTFLSDMKRIS